MAEYIEKFVVSKTNDDLVDEINTFINLQEELEETYEEAIDLSVNNLIVAYLKKNPIVYQKYSEDGNLEEQRDVSDLVRRKIRASNHWMEKLRKTFISTYLGVRHIENIPTRQELKNELLAKEMYASYQKSLMPATLPDLKKALSVILYNTHIEDIQKNVTRIIYAMRRIHLGHPDPDIGSSALFIYSVGQGSGKSVLVQSFMNAAQRVGLSAMIGDLERITNCNFADMTQPLDNYQMICQPSFLKESKQGVNRKVLENLIDSCPIRYDVKFKNCVTQTFNGLIIIGSNVLMTVNDRRYSVIHLVEDKLSKFANKPSIQDIDNACEYLLTHTVGQHILKKLVHWEVLNNYKGVQNSLTKADLYDVLQNCVDYFTSDADEKTIQVQSVLSKFKNTIGPELRDAYKNELQSLVDQGIIKCDTKNITNISKLTFSRNSLGRLDYGDGTKTYDYENHTKLISKAIEDYLPDSLENQDIEDGYKTGDFLEWGLYGYDPEGEFNVLNNLKSADVPEGYVSPRVQSNCFMNRFLYESDNLLLVDQKAVLEKLIQKKAVYRAVYSGSKSIHIIVEIDHECSDIKEYKFFWKEISQELGLNIDYVDNRCSENSRLSRRPGKFRVLEKEKFDKYSKDAVELFGATVEPEACKIEQKLLYDGYDIYNCYFRIKKKYLESKIADITVTSKKIHVFDGQQSDINRFISNYAKKNDIDLDFSEGNGHNLGCRLIGACTQSGFNSNEIEDWLRENCSRFDELRKEWKGLL